MIGFVEAMHKYDCDKNSVANKALRSKSTVSLAKHDKDIMHIEEIRQLSWFSVQI